MEIQLLKVSVIEKAPYRSDFYFCGGGGGESLVTYLFYWLKVKSNYR